MEDRERQLLERLAAEGKSTRLYERDMPVAKSLEGVGLLFLVGNNEPYAIMTPKGRRLLAELARKPPKPPKPPVGFLDELSVTVMREDGKMKALGDAIVAIIGVAMFAICAIIILTADYNPIRAQMYALFAVVARVLRTGATG